MYRAEHVVLYLLPQQSCLTTSALTNRAGCAAQAVVVSSGGKLTVALYTLRHVLPGEELTFDYSSVTENEREFKVAYCMCSTRHCRGSYLYYTGSKAYMQVMEAAEGLQEGNCKGGGGRARTWRTYCGPAGGLYV